MSRLQSSRAAFALALAAVCAGVAHAESPVREHYVLHCSGCHGIDGAGVSGTTPSLRTIGPLLLAEGGRAYLGRVPGVAQAPLGDAELAALLNWVMTELAGVRPEPLYSPEEVSHLRATPLRDTAAARQSIIAARPEVGR